VSCCETTTDGGSPSGGGSAAELRELEIVWTEQGTRTLTAGTESFVTTDGDTFDWIYTQAGLDVVTVSPANGLQWVADIGTGSSFTQATQTATRLMSALGAANGLYEILDIDVTWEIRLDTYATLLDFPSGSPYWQCGLFGASGSPLNAGVRLASAGRGRLGGGQVWWVQGSSAVEYDSAPGPTTNVTGFICRNNAVQVHAGNWPLSASWADLRLPICWAVGRVDAAPQPPMQDQNTSLVLAFATNVAGVLPSVRLERTRIQARSF
jgi:hypothetical protein